MFTKQPKPGHCPGVTAWWPVYLGATLVLAAMVAVGVLLLSPRTSGSRRVVVSFADEGAATAARARHPLTGAVMVRGYGAGALILAVGGGVRNAEVILFYTRAVAVEDDPMIEPTALAARNTTTGVAVIDGGFATDIAEAIAAAAAPRIALLGRPQRGPCPSYLQAAISRAAAPVLALNPDGGTDSFPSNCAGVLVVSEVQLRGRTRGADPRLRRGAFGVSRGAFGVGRGAQAQEVGRQRDAHDDDQQAGAPAPGKERADGALDAAEVGEDGPPPTDDLERVAQAVPEPVGVHVLEDRVEVAPVRVDTAVEHGEPETVGHRGGQEQGPVGGVREDVKATVETDQGGARVKGDEVSVHHVKPRLTVQLQKAPTRPPAVGMERAVHPRP